MAGYLSGAIREEIVKRGEAVAHVEDLGRDACRGAGDRQSSDRPSPTSTCWSTRQRLSSSVGELYEMRASDGGVGASGRRGTRSTRTRSRASDGHRQGGREGRDRLTAAVKAQAKQVGLKAAGWAFGVALFEALRWRGSHREGITDMDITKILDGLDHAATVALLIGAGVGLLCANLDADAIGRMAARGWRVPSGWGETSAGWR